MSARDPDPMPHDWPKILEDLAWLQGELEADGTRRPLSLVRLAEWLQVSRTVLRNIQDGTEPRYADGVRYLRAWSQLSGKDVAFAPRVARRLA